MSEPLRVLVMDDNPPMLARATAVLKPTCAVVGTADNGTSALEAATELQPDVIVLDISMPGLTGFEVAVRLREEGSSAAVVFLTVHQEQEFVEAAYSAGALGYVAKSRLTTDLPTAVREASDGRRFASPLR